MNRKKKTANKKKDRNAVFFSSKMAVRTGDFYEEARVISSIEQN